MDAIDQTLTALRQSRFRRRFTLHSKERAILSERGLATILAHGRTLLSQRLAPANPPNDGKQTPMRGHPIFIAQHATATCCRNCLRKWHHIENNQPLSDQQIDYILTVIERWLQQQPAEHTPVQLNLFDQTPP